MVILLATYIEFYSIIYLFIYVIIYMDIYITNGEGYCIELLKLYI